MIEDAYGGGIHLLSFADATHHTHPIINIINQNRQKRHKWTQLKVKLLSPFPEHKSLKWHTAASYHQASLSAALSEQSH